MESWREAWRVGFAPELSADALAELAEALRADDPRLVQGRTSLPHAGPDVLGWPVEATCAVGFCCWRGEALTVGMLLEAFDRVCYEADLRLAKHRSASHDFLAWFDTTPRDEARRLLLPEVELALSERRAAA